MGRKSGGFWKKINQEGAQHALPIIKNPAMPDFEKDG
jgi:hypothetical protein